MLHLLTLEWKKLSSNTTFKVLTILYAVFLPMTFLMWKYITGDVQGANFEGVELATFLEDPYMFPHVWKSLGYLGSWFNFYLLGIVGILIVTNEYDYKTLRQSIINGLTRREYFTGKLLIVAAISVLFSLYYCILGLVIGFFNTDAIYMSKVLQNAHFIPKYAIQIFGYMSIAVFFGWLFRRFALSLLFYFFYPIGEFILLNGVFLAWMKIWVLPILYFPMNVFNNLIPFYSPISFFNAGRVQMISAFEEKTGLPYFLPDVQAIPIAIVFIVLFVILSYRRFINSDL